MRQYYNGDIVGAIHESPILQTKTLEIGRIVMRPYGFTRYGRHHECPQNICLGTDIKFVGAIHESPVPKYIKKYFP